MRHEFVDQSDVCIVAVHIFEIYRFRLSLLLDRLEIDTLPVLAQWSLNCRPAGPSGP